MAVSDPAVNAAATAAQMLWEPTWYNVSDQAIVAVKAFHDLTGVEYGWAIVGVTVMLRLALFPLMVKSQQTTSRMAHVQPELTLIKSRYEALGTPSRQDQLAFSKQMKALFAKYQVQPFQALLAPVVQLPLFMGMFFGLRKMPGIYHDELASGGMFWFVDLTVPDPLYILPLASASTFLLLIELGKDQMMAQNAATGKLMVNVFRVMSLVMIPVCVNFEAAMLCYWTANNLLTLAQTQVLKAPLVKKQFGIWDPPKPVPGLEPESLTEAATKLIKRIQGQAVTEKQEMERHNQEVEVKKKGRSFQATMRNRLQQRGSGSGGGGVTGKRTTTNR
jgi:YidC/Oxa1 family membrane protein insertase